MREFSVPALVGHAKTANLTDLVWSNAAEAPTDVLFSRPTAHGWADVTSEQFRTEVTAVAKGLIASGVGSGDRVGLMSRTRYEWTLFDFAIWAAGAVTVPIYETSSAEQVAWILGDSGATAVIVETPQHQQTVESVRPQLPALGYLWSIEADAVRTLTRAGSPVDTAEVDARRAGLTADSLATIIYTSGTTGRPKGCELTHGNFLFELGNAVEHLQLVFREDRASTLLFIPLAHVFARVIQVGCVQSRSRMGHTSDVTNLLADLATFRPTFILSVPRVFEKVYNSASQKAHAGGKGRIFDRAADTAIAYSRSLDSGGPSPVLRLLHGLFDRLVYAKLRSALGGEARWAISGGAPLGERLGHFYRGIGLTVLEGYGLTETTAAATVNPPYRVKMGTVGKPLPGTAVRIAPDGEVLLSGGHTFRGYWHNETATKESLDDGWLLTGDLGELDDEGYLRITGRKKEIIVTSGGKNVAPAVLEDRIRAHPLVSQCMVVGDRRAYVAALVTIDAEALTHWKSQHGKPAEASVAQLYEDPELRSTIEQAIDEANGAVSRAESIRRFRILPVDFTEEGGQLTPTLKLKRAVVAKHFADDIEALYAT
ncbi:MAG: AMP-dependent synthetase/ligase [Carbonactinosporaceae bacterium]